MGDGSLSDRLKASRDWDKGVYFLFSPLLLNIFPAAIEVVLELFSKHEVILSELVQLDVEKDGMEERGDPPGSTSGGRYGVCCM